MIAALPTRVTSTGEDSVRMPGRMNVSRTTKENARPTSAAMPRSRATAATTSTNARARVMIGVAALEVGERVAGVAGRGVDGPGQHEPVADLDAHPDDVGRQLDRHEVALAVPVGHLDHGGAAGQLLPDGDPSEQSTVCSDCTVASG